MYSVDLQWKSFNVSLPAIENWCRTYLGENYIGNSADTDLTLWFTSKPDDATKAWVQAYWDSINESSTEVINYVSSDVISTTIAGLKADLITKSWDQMTIVERKLVTNQAVTLEDLGYNIDFHIIPDGYEGYGS